MTESLWPGFRERYLPAMSQRTINALPNKTQAWVLLTTGAVEQHGPHLPLGVDSLLAQGYLQCALPLLPAKFPLYLLPPITVGKSNEHSGFAGSLILHRERLRQQILACGRQLQRWGFANLAVLNTHGGNTSVLKSCLRELSPSLRVRLLDFPYARDCAPREECFGIHAGELETALMLALAPEQVRMEAADCCWIGSLEETSPLRPEFAPATYAWETSDLSPTGTMGDARNATAANGQLWLARAAKAIAEALQAP